MRKRDDPASISASSASCLRNSPALPLGVLLFALLAGAQPSAALADEPGKAVPAAKKEPAPASAPDQRLPAPADLAVATSAAPDCTEIPECVELVQVARRLSDANQLNAALTSYQTAYAQYPSAWLLINIGRVQQKRGRPAEAITTYRTYLGMPRLSAVGTDLARRYLAQAEQDLAALREKERPGGPRGRDKPLYKKGVFWAVLGSGVVAAGAITAGVIMSVSAGPKPDRTVPANTLNFSF